MKLAKKICALLMAVMMLFSLAGCAGDDSAELVGTWRSNIDILDMLLDEFESDPSTADFVNYVEMDEFVIEMTLVFTEDGTYTMTVDEETFDANLYKMVEECVTGYLYEYFEDYFAQMELEGTVDEILALMDMNMADLVTESLKEVDLSGLSESFNQHGNYKASDGKLYRSDGYDTIPDPNVYEPYTLENNKLILTDYINNGESDSIGYPMVFNKVA